MRNQRHGAQGVRTRFVEAFLPTAKRFSSTVELSGAHAGV